MNWRKKKLMEANKFDAKWLKEEKKQSYPKDSWYGSKK